MKAKKILAVTASAVIAATASMPAYAATLTDTAPGGETEVTAHITGSNPGDVSYVITIPDVVDFGELTQPANKDSNDFKDVGFDVELTEVSGLDPDAQKISVYVRDDGASIAGDQEFYITNKVDSTKKFQYDLYDIPAENITETTGSVNANTMSNASGYYLTAFTTAGDSLNGTLRLNQIQLCDYSLAEIVGEYSGHMVFFSTVENN